MNHHHNPRAAVVGVIREHVAAAYPAWRKRAEDPLPSPSGPRYFPGYVADLLGPALTAVSLLVWEDWYSGAQIFVTANGRQITRERLLAIIEEALAGHEDRVLRSSVGSRSFWEHLASRVPVYEGEEIERARAENTSPVRTSTERSRATRERQRASEEASARRFLVAVRGRAEGREIDGPDLYADAVTAIGRKVKEAREGFVSACITDEDDSPVWRVPGKGVFYRVADEVLGSRVRRSRGFVYLVRKIARTLRRETVSVLITASEILGRGPRTAEEAEQYADEAVGEVRALAPASAPDVLDPRVLALPFQVAHAVAGDPDGIRAFARMARFHLSRHPEDRPAVAAVAVALRAGDPDGLIDQIRARIVRALDAEEASA